MKNTLLSLFILGVSFTAHALPVAPLADGYHAISHALAYDEYGKAQLAARDLVPLLETWLHGAESDPRVGHVSKMNESAKLMAQTSDAKALRKAYYGLTDGALRLIVASGLSEGWQLWYCPMVKAYWAQPMGESIANPYHGSEMLECGVRKKWSSLPNVSR